MTYLDEPVFLATVRKRIKNRWQDNRPADFNTIAAELLDLGLVPRNPALWEQARAICQGVGTDA